MHKLTRLATGIMAAAVTMIRPSAPSVLWSALPRALRRGLMARGYVCVTPMAGGATGLMLETMHVAKGIDPVADAFAGANKRSDVYAMRDYESVVFLVYIGVGTTGTSTIVVNSCDDVTPSNRTAIKYYSRDILATDVQGAITERAAAGYIPAAGSSKIVLIEVRAQDLVEGDAFVEIEFDESVDAAVLGGVCAIFFQGRYKEDVSPTVLA